MNDKKRPLFLITDCFPYGAGESFVRTELQYLCEWFDVTVIPRYVGKGAPRALPEGVKLLDIAVTASFTEKMKYVFRFFLGKRGRKEVYAVWKSGRHIPRRLFKSLAAYVSAELIWKGLKEKRVPSRSESAVFYSFWYTPAALALSFHREELSGARLIARTNGYDLYNERAYAGRQPFKPAADAGLDVVISSCRYGQKYYEQTFGLTEGVRYIYSALGSENDFGMSAPGEDALHLVSCSAAAPGKRIERIIDGLAALEDTPVRWTHIGGGRSFAELKTRAEDRLRGKKNIQWQFTGELPNDKLLELYKTMPVDCFITTSESEGGCPVSIQEAMSFGVPVIGTAVGGITEMLVESDNILLTPDPDAGEVAEALKAMYTMPPEQKDALRQANRRRWEERYNAADNGRKLAGLLDSLWEET